MNRQIVFSINNAFLVMVKNEDEIFRPILIGQFMGMVKLAEAIGEITYQEFEYLLDAKDSAMYGRTFGY